MSAQMLLALPSQNIKKTSRFKREVKFVKRGD